ncbi:uroporphyrinogen-III synthase [Alsobacter sp. SYSU M60028]|uniref:Uroporphyrinogen-III synthase n=1 Tax=Alsobacter ponti TaxID=2962936 RepID=A0ABT1LB77_9HYPH|nr:uroporphyrinogen-III synthase [Alsobacter ponti]MCP8938740.1 uroporphyrinogen-III synthase [Alsobacter ponti]
MRVVVTRPEPDAARTARRLAALGYTPVVAPLFEAVATSSAPAGDGWAAVVATSARAFLAGAADPAALSSPLFAVGERTASAARAAGFRDVRAAGGTALALSQLLARELPAGARVLYLAGTVRKPELEARLAAAGLRVTVRETYAMRRVSALPAAFAELLRSGAPALVLHYSRRGAETALDLAARAGLQDALAALAHRALSADVAEPLQRAGASDVVVAVAPDEDSLFATLPPCG